MGMQKENPARDHLDLTALFPAMPASFSERVDDALDTVRRDRRYLHRHIRRNRGTFAACACAAALVLAIGGTLLRPLLKQENPITASKVQKTENVVLMTAVPSATDAPKTMPTPTPQATPSPTVSAEVTPMPTATPHINVMPVRSIDEATPYQIESSVVTLIELVHLSIAHRTVMDMSGIMEITPETKPFLTELETAIAAIQGTQAAENPDILPAIMRFDQKWGDTVEDTLFVTCAVEWSYDGGSYAATFDLGFAMRQDGLYIVSFAVSEAGEQYLFLSEGTELELVPDATP